MAFDSSLPSPADPLRPYRHCLRSLQHAGAADSLAALARLVPEASGELSQIPPEMGVGPAPKSQAEAWAHLDQLRRAGMRVELGQAPLKSLEVFLK